MDRRRARVKQARLTRHEKDERRFAKYGITRQWYEAQEAAQGNRCANSGCRTDTPGGRWNVWHIDHDHDSGVVRGLLCDRCNKAVGLCMDSPKVLNGLAEYAAKHSQLRLVI
jgi:hypothetical protein